MVAVHALDTSATGRTLRRARELAGLDLTTGARAVGIPRRDLRSIERGRRGSDVDLVERAVVAYGGEDLVLPPRDDLLHPTDPTLLVVGDERVRLDPFRETNDGVLVDYVAAVRRQRGLDETDEVPFRSHDLVQLASVLDLTTDDLERQLIAAAGLSDDRAHRAARMLVLTGLCLAVSGLRPTGSGLVAAGDGGTTWLTPVVGRPVFSVDARIPSPESDVRSIFTIRSGRPLVAHDTSWLARDGRAPAFSVVPRVQLDAIAELIADAPARHRSVAPAELPPAPADTRAPAASSDTRALDG